MRFHKTLNRLVSFLCAVSLLFSVCHFPTIAVAANAVTATTGSTVKQGNTAYCHVYIDSLERLSALDVSVHFDNTKVKITGVYNSVSCSLYDSTTKDSSIQFSYIFDGEGAASQTQLFYFSYEVLANAEVGDAYFDITIGEAYDNALNDVSVSGSRCVFTIAETITTNSCSVYGSRTVSTSVKETFTLNYRFSTYQIASGSAEITYDPELFEVEEVTAGAFLDGKIADINASMPGSIYISFVGTEYTTGVSLVTIKFKTLKNVAETSRISLKVTELLDLALNPISCTGYNTTVTINYDESYVGDASQMVVNAEYDENTNQVTAVIRLAEKSKLGAGDFVLLFDPTILNLTSYTKGFVPSFFNINDKQVAEGVLKFSIISLEDILEAETVLTLVFDATLTCTEQTGVLDLRGDMLTDSLTKPILLNFVNGKVTLPEKHEYSSDCDNSCNLCNAAKDTGVPHSYTDPKDMDCDACGYVRALTDISLSSKPTKLTYLEGKDLLDVTGGKITLSFGDGSTAVIDLETSMINGFDNTAVGMQELTVTYGGCKDTYNVEIVAKSLENIRVSAMPEKTEYLEAKELLDLSGGKLLLIYNNGTSKEMALSDAEVIGFDNTKIGKQTLTVKYQGKETSFSVEVIAKSVVSIAVTEKPIKITYLEGDSFDATGMVVTAYYDNDTSEPVTAYSVVGYDSTPGSKTITVAYEGKTAFFTVGVTAKSLTAIGVTQQPTKLIYLEGDTFAAAGMIVTAYYNNNTSKVITDYTVTGYDPTPGTKTITVTYGGYTDTFTVEVSAKALTSIAVTKKPTKLTYIEGTVFDPTGMVVTAHYNNGTTEVMDLSKTEVVGFDNTKIGTQTLTVKYQGKETSFSVDVIAKSVVSIEVTKMPDNMHYVEGMMFDSTGMELTVNYDNGTSETVYSGWREEYDFRTVGQKTVHISYDGKTTVLAGIVVDSRQVIQINVLTPVLKTTYLEGAPLDTTGLTIRVDYNDGSHEVLDSGWQIQGFLPDTPGRQTVTVCFGGKETVFTVTVEAKTLTGISISNMPTKLIYLEGAALNTTGLQVKATYNNGTTAEITDYTLTGYSSTPGTKTIEVSYGGKTTTFVVTVNAKTLTGISLISPPAKVTYLEGEALDTTGLQVKATYDNGTTAEITDYTLTGYSSTAGTKTIEVSYGGKTTTFVVIVNAKTLTGISLISPPAKVTYLEGETLDTTGLQVKATYNNGTTAEITDYVLSGYNSAPGAKTIEVSYGGKTTTFVVTVKAKTLTEISLVSPPEKLTYIEGAAFDPAGMVVAAYYNNGTTEVIALSKIQVDGFDNARIGKQTLVISFGGRTCTVDVTIVAKSLESIAVTTKPTKLSYLEGDSFDATGMIVMAYYNNHTSGKIVDYTISGYSSTVGTKTITVSYGGQTATFTVTVNSRVPSTITSSQYTISGDTISKITVGTTASALLKGINEGAYCKVYKGNTVVDDGTVVGTGMIVKIMDGSMVKASYTIIVTGDTNGDGNVTVTDMIAIKAHLLKKTVLSGAAVIAADTNGDSSISITDFIQVKAAILGKGSITAR